MILIDAGPLIALLDADDGLHARCEAALKTIREPLFSVWPVIAEAMYMLARVAGGRDALWEVIVNGTVHVLTLAVDDVPRMRELMQKYSDIGMDLADAALIRVAERDGIDRFFTTDRRDFSVYRLHGRTRPRLVPL